MTDSFFEGGLKGWGKPGEEDGPAALDKNDPNYEDPEDI